MEKMKMGILGSGGIAHTMANTVKQMADVELYAVGARTLEKAQSFAEEFGMPKAYGSYEELAADPELDLVYVATPHSHHYPHVKYSVRKLSRSMQTRPESFFRWRRKRSFF